MANVFEKFFENYFVYILFGIFGARLFSNNLYGHSWLSVLYAAYMVLCLFFIIPHQFLRFDNGRLRICFSFKRAAGGILAAGVPMAVFIKVIEGIETMP